MKPRLIIHMKSGKTVGVTHEDVKEYLVRYSDWLATGDEELAPVIDVRDQFGAGVVVHFANIEYLEVEGR
jgi:hypothetical protein